MRHPEAHTDSRLTERTWQSRASEGLGPFARLPVAKVLPGSAFRIRSRVTRRHMPGTGQLSMKADWRSCKAGLVNFQDRRVGYTGKLHPRGLCYCKNNGKDATAGRPISWAIFETI